MMYGTFFLRTPCRSTAFAVFPGMNQSTPPADSKPRCECTYDTCWQPDVLKNNIINALQGANTGKAHYKDIGNERGQTWSPREGTLVVGNVVPWISRAISKAGHECTRGWPRSVPTGIWAPNFAPRSVKILSHGSPGAASQKPMGQRVPTGIANDGSLWVLTGTVLFRP